MAVQDSDKTMKKSGLRRKTLFSTGALMVVIIIILATLSIINLNSSYEQVIDQTEQGFDLNIKIAVETVISALDANHQEYLNGSMSADKAVENAKRIVRDTRYSSAFDKKDDGYFWADMADGYCVVHYNPNNEGAMRWDAQDQEGTYFIRKFIELGDIGGGYSDFYFGKPGDESGSHKKRGYTQKFEPYGWYISTGNYYEDIDNIVSAVEAEKLRSLMTLLTVAVLIAALGLVLLSTTLNTVVKPIRSMSDRIRRLTLGDSSAGIFTDIARKDEIGELQESITKLAMAIDAQTAIMQAISEGNYSVAIDIRSDEDIMNQAINHMLDRTNITLNQIRASTEQVATGSQQIASGAQSLARGTAEQTGAIEHLSSSIADISAKIRSNAAMAGRAATLADTIKHNAEEGNKQMGAMITAVNDINQASQSINSVISLIDDIAFQTNILALNAAVEAARAGAHGKGFAVVADEVRNLAAKSAEAAKDTGGLLADSIEKAELGAQIANETAASLIKIVSGINESTEIAGEIAKLSEEQSQNIDTINLGIEQVRHVIHHNSSTAEESAAASEQMSSQSSMLKELLSGFRLR